MKNNQDLIDKPGASLSVAIADLFGVDLQPYQKAFEDQTSEIERTRPEGCEVRYFCCARHPGWFAMRDRQLKHKWNGREWRPFPSSPNT